MMSSAGSSSPRDDQSLMNTATAAISEQFYQALFDRLFDLLCAEYQARLWFYQSKEDLRNRKLAYNARLSISDRAQQLSDLITHEQQYAPDLCKAIQEIISASKNPNESTFKSFHDAAQGIRVAAAYSQIVDTVVKPILNTYSVRQSDCDFLTQKSAVFQETSRDWFVTVPERTNENIKKLVIITRAEQPKIPQLQRLAQQQPISYTILTELKRAYGIQDETIQTSEALLQQLQQRNMGATSLSKRFVGAVKSVTVGKDPSQKSEYDRVKELLEVATTYDAQEGHEAENKDKKAKGEVLRAAYNSLKNKVAHKHSWSKELTRELHRSSLETTIQAPSLLVQSGRSQLSLSEILIAKLAELFDIVHVGEPLTGVKLLKYFKDGAVKYRFGKWGSVFHGHVIGPQHGTLEKLLDAVAALDKPGVQNRAQLVEDVKRRLTRLRERYSEKTAITFDEFLLRLDYPITSEEKKYAEEIEQEKQSLQAYITLWQKAHPEGRSYDLDNLPADIAVPTIEDIQQLVLINTRIDSVAIQKHEHYPKVLRMLATLYDYSKSLYFTVLQAYVLALSGRMPVDLPEKKEDNKALENSLRLLLNSIWSVLDNENYPTMLQPADYIKTQSQFSWPGINVTDRFKIIKDTLSLEKMRDIFPLPSSLSVSTISAVATAVSSVLFRPKTATTSGVWSEFEDAIKKIQSEHFIPLNEMQKQQIATIRSNYPDQPRLALMAALIYWFSQASPYVAQNQSRWNVVLMTVSAQIVADQVNDQGFLPLFVSKETIRQHESNERFLKALFPLYIEAIAGSEFLEAARNIMGKSTNFMDLSNAKVLGALLKIPESISQSVDPNLYLMLALVTWFPSACKKYHENFSVCVTIATQIKEYCASQDNAKSIDCIDISQLPDPKSLSHESDQRFVIKVCELYTKAAWPKFARIMETINDQMNHAEFSHVPPAVLRQILLLKKNSQQRDADFCVMQAVIVWASYSPGLTKTQQKELVAIESKIEKYLSGGKDFPDIKLPAWKKPESVARLTNQLTILYEGAAERYQKAVDDQNQKILLGEEVASDFKVYFEKIRSLISPSQAYSDKLSEIINSQQSAFRSGVNPAVITARIICRYFLFLHTDQTIEMQLNNLRDIFTNKQSAASTFSITKEKQQELLSAIQLIEGKLPVKVIDMLRSVVDKLTSVVAAASRESIITEKLPPMSDSERLSSKARDFGYSVHERGSDGDCLFLSIADQEGISDVTERADRANELRAMAVREVMQHASYYRERYAPADHCDAPQTFDAWIKEISQSKKWGDQVVAHALARVLNRPIVIVASAAGLEPQVMKPVDTNADKMIVIGNLENWHYQSLQPIFGDEAKQQQLKQMVNDSPCLLAYPSQIERGPSFRTKFFQRVSSPWDKTSVLNCVRPYLKSISVLSFNDVAQANEIMSKALNDLASPGDNQNIIKEYALYCLIEVFLDKYALDDHPGGIAIKTDKLFMIRDNLLTFIKGRCQTVNLNLGEVERGSSLEALDKAISGLFSEKMINRPAALSRGCK